MISENDYHIISNYQGQRVVVSYDIEDLSEVYLWRKQGVFLVSLCSVKEFKKIIKYGPNAELGRISQEKARQRRIKEMKEAEFNRIVSGVGEEALLMGIHTKKAEANAFEDEYNKLKISVLMKKVSGDDFAEHTPDDLNIDKVITSFNL